MSRLVVRLFAAAFSLGPASVSAQDGALSLEGALQRAREHSVAVLSARSRVAEAQARLRGAQVLRDNPLLEGAAGRRSSSDLPADLDFALSQTFELGGRRGARVAAAEAGIAREEATVDDVSRRALRDVALAFLRGLATGERIALARTTEAYVEQVLHIAERRYAAGDVAVLDVNLAAVSLSRARSQRRAAEAAQALALGELRVVLALEPEVPLTLVGELGPPAVPEADALLEAAAIRSDVKSLEAETRGADAEIEFGQGARWPDLTPAVRFERDEGTNVLWGGITLSLPLWNRGQETSGVAQARSSRLRLQTVALRRAARAEVRSALEAHRLRVDALAELETTASRLEENASLARRSYEVGQIGLAELILVGRETVEARLLLLERRLEVAESGTELLAKAGVLR
jgi:cobalt-zinc-cadmium efflux system outer membrane protein